MSGRACVVVVCVAMALATMARARVWTDERRLWSHAVTHSPEKPRSWNNLGGQYLRRGADDLAWHAYRTASDLARSPGRAPDERQYAWAVAQANLALLEASRGCVEEAYARVRGVWFETGVIETQRVLQWLEQQRTAS